MGIPSAAPDPQDWLAATLRTQAEMQRDVLVILKQADARIKVQLKEILSRRTVGPAALVRQEQLKLVQRNLRLEMARIWTQLGDKVQARRLEAAARSIKVGEDLNKYLLGRVGGRPDAEDLAAQIAASEEDAARSGLDRMIARAQGTSYNQLSQRVYNSSIAVNGTVDRLVNTALARGLSAKELADEVLGFINPNTPGGARYASMRLARTEINNAAHAVAVKQAQDSPWVESMQWRLSGSHPKPDICDTLASGGPKNDGAYPKTSVPAKPHPQCFCYVTPVTPSDDDFLDALVGGKYDDYLKRYAPAGQEESVLTPIAPKKSALQASVDSGVKRKRRLTGGSVAETSLATMQDGSKVVFKKTGRGADGDFLKSAIRQQDAEVLAAKVGKAFGVDVPDVIRLSPQEIAMEFKPGKAWVDHSDDLIDAKGSEGLREIANQTREILASREGKLMGIFDQIIYNVDRHEGNFLLYRGKPIGIDHGYAFYFPPNDVLQPLAGHGAFFSEQFTDFTHVPGRGGRIVFGSNLLEISDSDLVELKRRIGTLRPDFESSGHLDWYEIMLQRVDFMRTIAKGTASIL